VSGKKDHIDLQCAKAYFSMFFHPREISIPGTYSECVKSNSHFCPGPEGRSIRFVSQKIGDDIAKAIQDWKGFKVTVGLTIQNCQAKLDVVLPQH
jgi:hypothetical protein